MARIIAVSNQKGGVGKTTTAISLAAGLAQAGLRTLLADMDPQGNATSGIGLSKDDVRYSVYHTLVGVCRPSQAIVHTHLANLDMMPANRELVGAEVELANTPERGMQLRQSMVPLKRRYDYIIIDCPPSLGVLTLNALVSADSVLVPLQCEYFALEGLGELVRTLQLVKNRLNTKLEREGILLTMYDRRNRLCIQVADEVRRLLGDLVFKTVIPRNVRLGECPSHGQTIFEYDARAAGAKAYQALTNELLHRHEIGTTS